MDNIFQNPFWKLGLKRTVSFCKPCPILLFLTSAVEVQVHRKSDYGLYKQNYIKSEM